MKSNMDDFVEQQNKAAYILDTAHKQLETLNHMKKHLTSALQRIDVQIKKHMELIDAYSDN